MRVSGEGKENQRGKRLSELEWGGIVCRVSCHCFRRDRVERNTQRTGVPVLDEPAHVGMNDARPAALIKDIRVPVVVRRG